jgi:deoxyribonuclease-2
MQALNESGKSVGWWFAYKLPKEVYACGKNPAPFKPSPATKVPAAKNDGYRYLYYEPGGQLALSPNTLAGGGKPGAVSRTLGQVFAPAGTGARSTGWVAYNDECPTTADLKDAGVKGTGFATNSEAWGHSKGVLGFDLSDGTGFWLIHSYPRWPAPGQTTFPRGDESGRLTYAQTFLCLSVGDLKTVENIAGMLRGYQTPQVIHSSLPPGAAAKLPTLAALVAANTRTQTRGSPPGNPNTEPGELTIQVPKPGGAAVPVRLFAKPPKWLEDFWSDLVAHRVGANLDVETWRRVTKTDAIPDQSDHEGQEVFDGYAVWVPDPGWYFSEDQDHGKWAVAQPADSAVVAVGDMNRQESQTKRGGGAVVLTDLPLAKVLRTMVVPIPHENITGAAPPRDDAALGGPELAGTAPPGPVAKRKTRVRPVLPGK